MYSKRNIEALDICVGLYLKSYTYIYIYIGHYIVLIEPVECELSMIAVYL